MLLCTVRSCHLPLQPEEGRYVCPSGHSFDVARSGYINLLQPQERRSRNPGDMAEAVAARRRFLDRGHGEPLLRAIRELNPSATDVLDVGCGEGYYLGSLARGCGIDISTAAIDLAARRYPDCQWIVANADRFVPYADASFDVVLSITGRMNAPEFRRVLRDDGTLLVGVAAPDDLIELRGGGRDRVPRTIETFSGDFKLIDQRRATAVTELTAEDVRDVLRATYRPAFGVRRLAAAFDPDESGAKAPHSKGVTLSLDLLLFCSAGKRDSRGGLTP